MSLSLIRISSILVLYVTFSGGNMNTYLLTLEWALMEYQEAIPFNCSLLIHMTFLRMNYKVIGRLLSICTTEKATLAWVNTHKSCILEALPQIEGNSSEDSPPSGYCLFHTAFWIDLFFLWMSELPKSCKLKFFSLNNTLNTSERI